jgi:hypothetical protein
LALPTLQAVGGGVNVVKKWRFEIPEVFSPG